MSQITELNEQILEAILKTDPFYEALYGKVNFLPETTITGPNDFNCGAIANGLEYLYQFVRELTEPEIANLKAPYIDIVVFFFTGLKRFVDETTVKFLNRMQSLTVRECGGWSADKLGTPWDILNVLCYYLDRELLYYIPNHVLTNLMVNGDFETALGAEWVTAGARTISDAFSGDWKMDFSTFSSLAQTIAVTAGSFIMNCFINPAVDPVGDTDIFSFKIQRSSDSKYFNTSTLVWQVADPLNVHSTDKAGYSLAEYFVIVDGSYNITITFTKVVSFMLDHVEFGEKLYPAFEIIYVDSGFADSFAATWLDGTVSPENASYIEQDFMFSSSTSVYSDVYFQSLIDTVKASGVKGIFNREVRS